MNSPASISSSQRLFAAPDLLRNCAEALAVVEGFFDDARKNLAEIIVAEGRISAQKLEHHQFEAHGLSWLATYTEALRQMLGWGNRLNADGKLQEVETLILQIAYGEYLAQIWGGIPMSQTEIIRLPDLGITDADAKRTPNIDALITSGNNAEVRARLAEIMVERGVVPSIGALGLDEDYDMIRDQFRRFAEDKVIPHAHEWHLKDDFIPLELVDEMGELGVFGLTIPEEYGGFGMSKTAMCVVSEELSRGYIGVGSLGTRSEIAAELILCGGTEEQKQQWLPKIASAEILPTAVFTEPNTGSDLGALKTRAVRDGDTYTITGNKTWITHASRADIMTLLARTDPDTSNHSGLSMFLAEKERGTDDNDFPTEGMSGGEIEVLGYRGMKEYELGFDGFKVKAENLLGQKENQGFRQLMQTFESARIQTAARAIGVAQNAMEIALGYAQDRKQFGKSIVEFPRVASKIALMAVEIMIARQPTYHSRPRKRRGSPLRSRGRHGQAAGRARCVVVRR